MLVKPTILDTQLGVQTNFKSQLIEAIGFLIKNAPLITISDKEVSSIKTIKNFGNSHMSSLFESIADSGKLDIFKFFDFSRMSIEDVPEILTLGSLTVDGYNTGIHTGDLFKKVWCNITPYIKKRTTEQDRLAITDIDTIHALVVRGALCKSYNEARQWLTPDGAAMIIESYALTITNILSSNYKLDFQDSNFVTLVFAAYYAQLLNIDGSMEYPELLVKCKKLHQMGVDIQAMSYINKYRDNSKVPLTIHEVCKLISKHGSSKMNSFTIMTLNALFGRGSVDIQTMLISLEYPPYFVTQLIRLADNFKNQVLLANPANKKLAPILVETLRTGTNFISKL